MGNIKKWEIGDLEAVINGLGEGNARRIASGGKCRVVWQGEEAVIEPPTAPLFDHTGRRIPPRRMQASVKDANRQFHIVQPVLDFAAMLKQYDLAFEEKAPLSVDEFQGRCVDVLAKLAEDQRLYNLLIGAVALPLLLPPIKSRKNWDYGTEMEQVSLPVAERAYKARFPERAFNNYRQVELANQVAIEPGTRHEATIKAMKCGATPAWYFPVLQGYSIPADREQMASLPEFFALAGGIDTAAVVALYPGDVARDFNTPSLDCAAVSWRSDYSLYFRAYGGSLDFDDGGLDASGSYAGGLVVLG